MVKIAKKDITVDDIKLVILLKFFEGASLLDEDMMKQAAETFIEYGFEEYRNELITMGDKYLKR